MCSVVVDTFSKEKKCDFLAMLVSVKIGNKIIK